MSTTYNGRPRYWSFVIAGIVAAAAMQLHHFAASASAAAPSSERAVRDVIDEVAGQVHEYCDARHLNTLQCLDFLGTHGSLSNASLETHWIESLKATGIRIRELDNTRIQGRIISESSGETSVLLMQCTLSDASGAELKAFRVRKVLGN